MITLANAFKINCHGDENLNFDLVDISHCDLNEIDCIFSYRIHNESKSKEIEKFMESIV